MDSCLHLSVNDLHASPLGSNGVGKSCWLCPPEPIQMIVDHPYWFFIRDEQSGTMLFAGRVEDPS
jgi:serine protease inhibitor